MSWATRGPFGGKVLFGSSDAFREPKDSKKIHFGCFQSIFCNFMLELSFSLGKLLGEWR